MLIHLLSGGASASLLQVFAAGAPVGPASAANLALAVLGGALALLIAIGVWLVYAPQTANSSATLAAVVLAALAFCITGFAFAMGGASGSYANLGPLAGLAREWTPRGPNRGLLGLQGFLLAGSAYDAATYALFILQAGLLTAAAVIAVSPWAPRAPRLVPAAFGLVFGGLLYPAYANWMWGGGWLGRIGQTLGHGHGAIDFAGSGVVNATAGLCALAALLALRPADVDASGDASRDGQHDEAIAGDRAALGLALAAIGGVVLAAAGTLSSADTRLAIAAANVMVAIIFGAGVGLLNSWLADGEPSMLLVAAAGLGGMAAVLAGAAFYPAWAAAVCGGVAGLIVTTIGRSLGALVRNRRGGLLAAAHGVAGLWGLLAAGLMADGSYGAGWNGIGVGAYLGVDGQGVTGLIPAGRAVAADPGQLTAQIIAALALLILPLAAYVVIRGLVWLAGLRTSAAKSEPAPEQA